MARTWLAIRVELLGGRGDELWPPPGRVFAVGPTHTFADLAEAIDVALARWDRAHLCEFLLADGTIVTDPESAEELVDSPATSFAVPALHLAATNVASVVRPGDEFRYVFDLGDEWTHHCQVEEEKVDPRVVLGSSPRRPTPYWGWGDLPDQYGRRWSEEPGEGVARVRPAGPHPMLTGQWPGHTAEPPVDLRELRSAIVRRDPDGVLDAIRGRDVGDVLQHIGSACVWLLADDRELGETVAGSLLNRLSLRDGPGDGVLVEELVAELRREPQVRRAVPVDLSELASGLEGSEFENEPGYLDLTTGDVVPSLLTEEGMVDEDFVDVEKDPDRWLPLEHQGSRVGWGDMADFVAGLPDGESKRRLEAAIEGGGAFRRFRDSVGDQGLLDAWRRFSDDRGLGRARQFLAAHGLRAVSPT